MNRFKSEDRSRAPSLSPCISRLNIVTGRRKPNFDGSSVALATHAHGVSLLVFEDAQICTAFAVSEPVLFRGRGQGRTATEGRMAESGKDWNQF